MKKKMKQRRHKWLFFQLKFYFQQYLAFYLHDSSQFKSIMVKQPSRVTISTGLIQSMNTFSLQQLAATNSISLVNAMQFVKNPFQMCTRVHEMIQEITARIRCLKIELKSRGKKFAICHFIKYVNRTGLLIP